MHFGQLKKADQKKPVIGPPCCTSKMHFWLPEKRKFDQCSSGSRHSTANTHSLAKKAFMLLFVYLYVKFYVKLLKQHYDNI